MATYGPRPSDTLDFAKGKHNEPRETPPWAVEDDAPRVRREVAPPNRMVLLMEIVLAAIAIVSLVALALGWVRF